MRLSLADVAGMFTLKRPLTDRDIRAAIEASHAHRLDFSRVPGAVRLKS
jgi:hypothetical protein